MEKYLSSGYELKLNNQLYAIIRMIGNGSTCAAYMAERDGQKYIIKEYCPSCISFSRDNEGSVILDGKDISKYIDGLNRFEASYQKQKELRKLPGIMNSTPFTDSIYEFNNTESINKEKVFLWQNTDCSE